MVGCGFFIWGASGAEAQDARPDTLEADSLVTGYEQLLREYRNMQRIPEAPDSTATDDPDARIKRLEIDGLVVDETQTRLGRSFYDTFYRVWESPRGAFNFTVTVQEQPVPNLGTRVTVRVNGEIAFQTQLQPREELVQGAARQAVYYVRHHLENRAETSVTY